MAKKNFNSKKNDRKDSWEDREARDERRDNRRKPRKGSEKSPSNDPGFYNKFGQLVTDAASIPYSIPTGSVFNLIEGTDYVWNDAAYRGKTTMPGVMAVYVLPTYGKSVDNTSAINICAQNLYSWVRHANSGHTNYDSPDLMMYILAMDSVYSMYMHLCRIYGIAQTYAQQNRYFPRANVEAMNVDFDSIINNLANFRYGINNLAVKIGSLCVPSSFSLYQRHMQIFSGYYLDAALPQAQIFEFVPYGFWRWEEIGDPGQPGKLILEKVGRGTSRKTGEDLLNIARDMVDAVLATEDFNIMSGDILKAFGESGLIKVSTISEDFTIMPTFDPVMSMQLHNTTVLCGSSDQPTIGNIENDPDTNAIISDVYLDISRKGLLGRRLLDTPVLVSNPDVNMEASRLTVTADDEVSDGSAVGMYRVTLDSYGTELAIEARIYYYIWTDSGMGLQSIPFSYTNSMHTTISSIQSMVDRISKFSNAPLCVLGTWASADANPNYHGILGDVTHYTTIGATELRKMHETALLSEFQVPQMGAFQP